MKTKKQTIYTILTMVAALQLLPVACTDYYSDWQPDENYTAPFTLSLELPLPKTAGLATRGLTEKEESDIQELTLLLFKTGTGDSELLETTRSIPGSALTRNATNQRLYTTTATLETGTYSTIMVLANSAADLSTPDARNLLTQGTPRSRIEKELLPELGDGNHWNTTGPDSGRFPMWGMIEGGNTGIVISNTSKNFSVKLYRMLAAIDLIIEQEDDEGNPLPAFKPANIYLCNFYRNGRMIPISQTTHYDGTTFLDASLPDDADCLSYTDPLVYSGNLADAAIIPDLVIRGEIYTFEQPPSDGAEESNAPFIILEGEYKDTGYNSFYRIDFVERQHEESTDPIQAKDNFLPIVRNHTYSIIVKEILGPGYRTLEEAAVCKPFNTVNEIFRFDDSNSESVQFDGKYYLSVSNETIHYDKEQSTRTLVVKTDSPLGWKINGITYSGGDGSTGWLTMDKENGTRDENGEVHLTAAAYNATTPTPREATFTITSGRMEYTIQVTQSHLQGISLEIVDADGEPLTEIWFRSNPRKTNPLQEQKFTVRWSAPNGCKMGVIMMGDRIFPFETNGHDAIYEGRTLDTGEEEYTFTITPTAFTESETDPETGNPFLQEGATVTFQVENEEEVLTRNIYIRHQCISIVIDNPEKYSYMGHQRAITLYSNTSWILQEVESELQNLFLIPGKNTDYKEMEGATGGYNTKTGDVLAYTVQTPAYNTGMDVYGLNRAGRKMSLTFRDTEGFAPDQTTDFIAVTPDPNCYLLESGKTIHIPLRKLFWIWERELDRKISPSVSSGTLSAGIIWQTENGLIQTAEINGSTGDYRDYILNVTTGNIPEGNALIAIRSGSEILWSFHIWVTGYNPAANGATFLSPGNTTFMDRNLGSNGNYDPDNLTPECAGLYYQWGRKDPFPGGKQLSRSLDLKVPENQYTLYGTGITFREIEVTAEKNLANSINNPTWFYTADPNNFPIEDWYTSKTESEYQNNYLWTDKDDRKTFFDPCPAGWRVSSGQEMEAIYQNPQVMYTVENLSYPTLTWGQNSIIFPNGGHIDDGILENAGRDSENAGYKFAVANLWDRDHYLHYGISEAFGVVIYPNGVNTRKFGLSVRCVKETAPW